MSVELYYFPECPFCQKVLDKVESLGLDIDLRNIRTHQEHREHLIEKTGRKTVPCLFINGDPLHESDDINRWLEENQAALQKG